MKKITSLIKKIAPWVVAAGIFVYLFHLYPPSAVWRSLVLVNLPAFIAFAVGYFVFIYIVDSFVMQKVVSKFAHAVSFKDIFEARGVTYLVMVLNYPASQAGFAYFLKRRYGIPIFEILGIFLFILFVDLMWIVTLAFAGSFFQDYSIAGLPLGHTVRAVALCAYALAFLWVALWCRLPQKLTGRKISLPFIKKITRRRLFHIFNHASPQDYLKVALMRIPIHFTIIISMFVVLHTFHVSIPFVKILGNVPLVFFIGTLPITPGGLGTTNAAMVELLSPYLSGTVFDAGQVTPKELLFAATLLWMFANYSLKIITGVLLMGRVSRSLFKPVREETTEEMEEIEKAGTISENY